MKKVFLKRGLLLLMVLLGVLVFTAAPALAATTIAEYNFDGNVNDISGNGNNGTIHGGVTYVSDASGPAASFDGTDGYISMPNDLISNYKQFTITMRFKTSSGGVLLGHQNVSVGGSPTNWVPIIYIGQDGHLRGDIWFGNVTGIVSPSTVNDGNWHEVTLSAGTNSISLYLDNVAIGTINNVTINNLDMSFNQLGAGYTYVWPEGNGGWFYYKGLIDDFCFSVGAGQPSSTGGGTESFPILSATPSYFEQF